MEGKFKQANREPTLESKIRKYVMQNSYRDYRRGENVNRDLTVEDIKDSLLDLDGRYDSADIPYLEHGLVLIDGYGTGSLQL